MRSFVITMFCNERSVDAAEECIASAARVGQGTIEMHHAITPKDNPLRILKREGISPDGFDEKYSRKLNCASAFLSHYFLWKRCAADGDENFTILEHDAHFIDKIPAALGKYDIVNFGKPSYGKWNTPPSLGFNPLTTKRYLPGAHAYSVTPRGAEMLVNRARRRALPTDVFINVDAFPGVIGEYFPFPVECRDTFTTIQNGLGCVAKHSYWKMGEDYEMI